MFGSPPKSPTQQKGLYYENLALKFLRKQGLRLKAKNYHCRFGEIDLILLDKQTLVFTEVRFRANSDFGHAFETVNRRKQQKLIKSAQLYLLEQNQYEKSPFRFDVLSICGTQRKPDIHWIKNAF